MKNINLIRFIVLVTMLTFFLSSCGLRGPLYLPPKTTTKEPSKASDAQKPNQLMSH
ncbi:MAG: lipoprotein [Betaproteobacteria bacterium]|nr:lipoprotein [Betaproteobacteria bacterium]MDE2423315.1 lipoprotein [Betaproteobacteria bacterium]